MKNITAQYRDLQEGKLSKANFMTNVRREFPQWISSGNTFDDAVRILKSKRILNENYNTSDPNIQSIANSAANMSETQDEVIANAIKLAKADGIRDQYVIKDIIGLAVDEFTSMGKQLDATKHRIPATDYSQRRSREDYGFNRPPVDPEIPFSGMTENGDDDDYDPDDDQSLHLDDDSDYEEFKEGKKLNEAEKKEPTIDQVDYIQLQRGTEFEMSKMPIISDENYAKAKQKAYKSLVKDSNAYRHLSVANYKDVKKKDKALGTQEVKKDNLADKANEQKTLVKNAKLNTKDTLGKQEKAKKGVPDGVKQLREAMLEEFQAVPEQKKTFAVGHEVATPDGKAGRIADLTQDNTATVEFPDGTTGDYQTNVLKVNVPGEVFRRNVGNPRADLSKFTMDELKEKLMKSMEEGFVVKSKKTGAVVDSGKNTAQGVTGAKNLEKTTGSQLKVVDMETGKETEV